MFIINLEDDDSNAAVCALCYVDGGCGKVSCRQGTRLMAERGLAYPTMVAHHAAGVELEKLSI